MRPSDLRSILSSNPEAILRELTTRQHLHPHQPLGDVLADATERLQICPAAGERAARGLGLDVMRPVGRLLRRDLIQLSRSVHRFWRQSRVRRAAVQTV